MPAAHDTVKLLQPAPTFVPFPSSSSSRRGDRADRRESPAAGAEYVEGRLGTRSLPAGDTPVQKEELNREVLMCGFTIPLVRVRQASCRPRIGLAVASGR